MILCSRLVILFLVVGTISNAQQILDSGITNSLNLNSNLKDSLVNEDYKTYMFVGENDSTLTYSLEVLLEEKKHRTRYLRA